MKRARDIKTGDTVFLVSRGGVEKGEVTHKYLKYMTTQFGSVSLGFKVDPERPLFWYSKSIAVIFDPEFLHFRRFMKLR